MKNIIFGIVLVVIVLGGLYLLPKGDKKIDDQLVKVNASIVANETLYDFGEIGINDGKVTTDFILSNTGEEDVTILSGTTSCGCTTGQIGGIEFGMHEGMNREFIIRANSTTTLKVVYDPLAHGPSGVGLAQRSVYLKTNSTVTPEIEVRVKAMVLNKKITE